MNSSLHEALNNNFKSKLFGLLNEREKDRDWEAFLDAILIELRGIPEEQRTINYYHLYYNISSLRYLNFKYFRTTVFNCMTLLGKMNNE